MKVGVWIWGSLALLSGISLVIGKPWTTIKARKSQPREIWSTPLFHEANMVLTAGWTAFYALCAGISAVTPGWVSPTLAVLTWPLGFLTYKAGSRYASWRLTNAAKG